MIFVSHAMEVSLLCDGLVLLAEGRGWRPRAPPEEIFAHLTCRWPVDGDVGVASLRPCPTTTSTADGDPATRGADPM